MSPASIVRELVRRGHLVALDDGAIRVAPPLPESLFERVRAHKARLVTYLDGLGAEPASAHAFVTTTRHTPWAARDGACIGCGIPWAIHGEPPEDAWQRVDDPDEATLIDAVPVEVEDAAKTSKTDDAA